MRQPPARVLPDPVPAYGPTAKWIHWLVALAVLGQVGVGLVMVRAKLPLDWKFSLYQSHKSIGVTILLAMAVRLFWRLSHRPPDLPDGLAPAERRLAGLAHAALYGLLIVLPLTGWLLVSSALFQVPTLIFGVVRLPHLDALASLPASARGPWETLFKDIHFTLAIALAALVALHAAAALRHHFIRGDDVLRRMLPGRRLPGVLIAMLAGALMAAPLATPANAAGSDDAVSWRIDRSASHLGFVANAGGQSVEGRFAGFEARIDFDRAHPEKSAVDISIDIATVSTGQGQIDTALIGPDWFDTPNHPRAHFHATTATHVDGENYTLKGILTLRGKALPTVVPFRFRQKGEHAIADGNIALDRTAFGIGPTSGTIAATVARQVRVVFHLEAEPE